MSAPVSLSYKASNVCSSCRSRKQGCDRALPRCSRCVSSKKPCDYTAAGQIGHPSGTTEELVVFVTRAGPCGDGLDLTSRAQAALLQAANGTSSSGLGFIELVSEVLRASHLSLSTLVDEYSRRIHPWLPILDEDLLRDDAPSLPDWSSPSSALLCLAIALLIRDQPCAHAVHLRQGVFYQTVKQLLAILPSSDEPRTGFLQANLVLALFECGHGLSEEAYITLSSCASVASLIFDMGQRECLPASYSDNTRYRSIILILDRTICLSSLDCRTPLICPTTPTPSSVEWLSQDPGLDLGDLSISSRVASATGRSLECARRLLRNGDFNGEEYASIDSEMGDIVKALVQQAPGNSIWTHCEPIALSLCGLLILHHARTQQSSPSDKSKETLALGYYRRMTWEICKTAIDMVQPSDTSHISFVSMCCVFRATVIMAETSERDIPRHEMERILPILRSFSKQWTVGVQYLERVESALKAQEDAI